MISVQLKHKSVIRSDTVVSAFPTCWGTHRPLSTAISSMSVTDESLRVTREGSQTPDFGDNYKTCVHLPLGRVRRRWEGVEAKSHKAQEGSGTRDQGPELRVESGHCDAMPSDSATRRKLQSEEGPSVFMAAARSPQKLLWLFSFSEVSRRSGGCILRRVKFARSVEMFLSF